MIALCNTLPDGSNALRIMGTPGKSGSLFFFSHDSRFIVKTLPKREAKLLREILPSYYQHIEQNPVGLGRREWLMPKDTLLPHFYGLHRLKPEYGSNVRFVVMNNLFATAKPIHLRFDIKGSTLGRSASASEKAKGMKAIFKVCKTFCSPLTVPQDLDLMNMGFKLHLGPERRERLLRQISNDAHVRFCR
jgi:1-phosphatidylinositol-4-phosphate 5-kinase